MSAKKSFTPTPKTKDGFPNMGRVENSGFPKEVKGPSNALGWVFFFLNTPRQDALLPEIQPDCLEELDSECLEDPLVILKCADRNLGVAPNRSL